MDGFDAPPAGLCRAGLSATPNHLQACLCTYPVTLVNSYYNVCRASLVALQSSSSAATVTLRHIGVVESVCLTTVGATLLIV